MKLLLLAFLAPAASGFNVASTTPSLVPSSETVDYVCEMTNMWTNANHPTNYPSGSAHWSPPVLAAHSTGYSMWSEGGMASAGVERVAEAGTTGTLRGELQDSSSVGNFVIGVNAFTNQVTTQTFDQLEMDSTNRYFSMISMVAPSPDWFTGFYDFEAVKESTGTWYREFVIATFPWDAGTEEGDTYSLGNSPTSPQQPIFQLTVNTVPDTGVLLSPDGTTVRPMSSFTCTLQQPDPEPKEPEPEVFAAFDVLTKVDSMVASTETVDYTCKFKNKWSGANHPNLYPSNAHWSPPILAAHTAGYTMWEEGGIASDGVEDVAETGSTSSLQSELGATSEVGAIERGGLTFNSNVQMQTFDSFEMTPTSRLLSTITMVAPSPDWFTGFYNFDAINDDTSTWYREFSISTYAWDAGTEEGEEYSGSNSATNPKEPIKRFNVNNLPSTNVFLSTVEPSSTSTVLPVATWTCTLEQEDPAAVPTICFSSRATVEVKDTGVITIDKLRIGDRVKVDAEDHFEVVYSFGHNSKTQIGQYLQIYGDMQSPLEISKDHMVFVNVQDTKKAVPASMVKVGDLLVMESGNLSPVTKISTVTRKGAFAPFTMAGTIVVNGVVSSSYVSLQGGDNVMIGSITTPFSNHFIAHLMTTPLRLMARFGLLKDEMYIDDGRSDWIAGPHYVAKLLLDESPFVFGAALTLAVTIMVPLLLVEFLLIQPTAYLLLVAAAAWYTVTKKDKTKLL